MFVCLFQSIIKSPKLEKQMSDDPFAVHDFDIKIDMDLPISSKYYSTISIIQAPRL